MRSLVGSAIDRDDDFDDTPPPPKRRPKPTTSRGRPKINRSKRGSNSGGQFSRWLDSFKVATRWAAFWTALLLLFFGAVTIAGLFSGGHVTAALAELKSGADGIMEDAGFTVGAVVVDGRAETETAEIGRVLGIKRGDLMLYVDVDEARARLEALRWVKSAEVRRIWPNHIHVTIRERKPVARWQIDGETFVIDGVGQKIAGERAENFSNLLLLVGKGAGEAAASFFALVATQPEFKLRVKAAVRVGERRWDLRLANGVEVRLPEEGAEAALAELVRLDREEKILARDIKAIDLRFVDRFIVKLPPGSPLIAPVKTSGGRDT